MLPLIPLTEGPSTVLCLPGLDCSRTLVNQLRSHIDGDAKLLWADYNQMHGLTIDRAAELLNEAIEAHRPSAVVAESLGSVVAMAWALENPSRGLPLILSGALSWTRRRKCTGWGRAAAWLVPYPFSVPCVLIGGQFVIGRKLPRPLRQGLIRDFSRTPRRAWLDRLTLLLRFDLRPRLSEIRAPMTLFWGEEDHVVWGRLEADLFRAAGHGGGIRMLPGVGHSIWAERPDLVAQEVRRHLPQFGEETA